MFGGLVVTRVGPSHNAAAFHGTPGLSNRTGVCLKILAGSSAVPSFRVQGPGVVYNLNKQSLFVVLVVFAGPHLGKSRLRVVALVKIGAVSFPVFNQFFGGIQSHLGIDRLLSQTSALQGCFGQKTVGRFTGRSSQV